MAATFPTTLLYTPSRIPSSNYRFNSSSFHYSNTICFKSYSYRFNRECCRMFRRCCSSLTMKDCSNGNVNGGDAVDTRSRSNEIWEDSQCVEVIGIGNRVDAVLDFCLSSTSPSQSLRFWSVIRSESRGQLRQKCLGKDGYPNIVEAPLNEKSYLKAVVLVASAGYGDDSVVATDILRAIKSGGGLVVAIMMKPFSFEGQRRRDEVKILANGLQDCVNFCIDIDIDTLLKMDLVTLDEALKTAYTAIFSAVRAVSILVSNEHKRHIHSLHGGFRQITAAEVIKVLESYKEGKVGFGFGHNVEDSITQAVYDCPFLSIGLKDLNGVVICIISSSRAIGDSEVRTLLRAFCQATECTREVVLSVVHDPDMKPNLIGTTVITVCVAESKSFHKTSLLSRLADSIPFVFNLLRGNYMQSESPEGVNLREDVLPPVPSKLLDKSKMSNMAPEEGIDQNLGIFSGKDILLNEDCDEKEFDYDATDEVDYVEADGDSFNYAEQNFEGAQALEREPLINRSGGSGFRIVPDRLEDDVIITGSVPVADNPRVFHLPVGVRRSDELQNTSNRSNSRRPVKRATREDAKLQGSAVPSVSSLNGFTDAGLDVVIDFWSSASSLLRGRQLDTSKKQGVLSARASSMLEAERDTNTKWSRMVEIGYKGGIYKGRCQGGLPEGRGRLIFQDDNVYDGMWRYGKRSGIGSLFFSNGDVFHGSWRDDLMHGKGWLYFHSGERWFANFWKGRANGEGRFYSKSGEVFFGQFQDGWRHGRFLCIKVDGTRYVETWNDGTLVSSEELEA